MTLVKGDWRYRQMILGSFLPAEGYLGAWKAGMFDVEDA